MGREGRGGRGEQGHKKEDLIDGVVVTEDSQTDSDSQTLFSAVDSQCLCICVEKEAISGGLGACSDSPDTVITKLYLKTISWIEQRF